MKQNIIYCIILIIIIIATCIYGSYSSIGKEEFQANQYTCDNLIVNISQDNLDEWFIGKDKNEPKMKQVLTFFNALHSTCKFPKVYAFIDDVKKSKYAVDKLTEIINDLNTILKNIQTTLLDPLLKKYTITENAENTVEGFYSDFYLSENDLRDADEENTSCKNLEEIIMKHYIRKETLDRIYMLLNGIERAMRDCNFGEQLNKRVEEILLKKYKVETIETIDNESKQSIFNDLTNMNVVMADVKNMIDVIGNHFNIKATMNKFQESITNVDDTTTSPTTTATANDKSSSDNTEEAS
jgi:hypothetical protein